MILTITIEANDFQSLPSLLWMNINIMRSTDETADLSSTDNCTLEMNQSEREELWDLLTFLETFCTHMLKARNNISLDQQHWRKHLGTVQYGVQTEYIFCVYLLDDVS